MKKNYISSNKATSSKSIPKMDSNPEIKRYSSIKRNKCLSVPIVII